MSDLRFVRELGAEFERLERAAGADSGRGRAQSRTARLTGRIAMAVALAVPLAIAGLAIALLSLSRHGGPHATTSAAPGLALSGGNCRTPAPTRPPPGSPPPVTTSDGTIRAAGGRVSGLAWQLRVLPDAELPGGLEHGRLRLGAHEYGLCSQQSVPVPFGLINAGRHGIVYGYVATGGGGYRITISAGSARITATAHTLFFIAALPRPACAYHTLSATATSTPVTGLPPDIEHSLDDTATRLTTTIRFGDCRPNALVTAASERGKTQGRSPNASLAKIIAQRTLAPPPGSHSGADGTVWELTHNGQRGIELFAVRLRPGRYGVWLLGPHNQATALAEATVKTSAEGLVRSSGHGRRRAATRHRLPSPRPNRQPGKDRSARRAPLTA